MKYKFQYLKKMINFKQEMRDKSNNKFADLSKKVLAQNKQILELKEKLEEMKLKNMSLKQKIDEGMW